MKTPMQEMFDQLKASRKDEYGLAFAIDMLLENEQKMLKKEKEVIVNAVKQGWDYNEEGLVQWMGETYYNETFNTKDCPFYSTMDTTSATICGACGKEKFEHNL